MALTSLVRVHDKTLSWVVECFEDIFKLNFKKYIVKFAYYLQEVNGGFKFE